MCLACTSELKYRNSKYALYMPFYSVLKGQLIVLFRLSFNELIPPSPFIGLCSKIHTNVFCLVHKRKLVPCYKGITVIFHVEIIKYYKACFGSILSIPIYLYNIHKNLYIVPFFFPHTQMYDEINFFCYFLFSCLFID